jgi:hypothetical protein
LFETWKYEALKYIPLNCRADIKNKHTREARSEDDPSRTPSFLNKKKQHQQQQQQQQQQQAAAKPSPARRSGVAYTKVIP